MNKKILIRIITVLLLSTRLLATGVEIIKNDLKIYNQKKNFIQLELKKIWGSEQSNVDEEFFKCPVDITVDNENNYYIADLLLDSIKVFDKKGNFTYELNHKGQGPGDIFKPFNIAIHDKTLWVYERGNRRIQCFSVAGRPINIFRKNLPPPSNFMFPSKDIIAVLNTKTKGGYIAAHTGDGIIFESSISSNKTFKIGAGIYPPEIFFKGQEQKSIKDYFCTSFNHKNQRYYIAYGFSQMIQIFSRNGEFQSVIFYKTLLNKLDHKWNKKIKNYEFVKNPKNYSRCIDIAHNYEGYTFIVVSNRLPKKNEKHYIVNRIPRSASRSFPATTNMYTLIVFDINNKIIATKDLDCYCSNIYIKQNRLFIIDSIFNKEIYEYEYKIGQ